MTAKMDPNSLTRIDQALFVQWAGAIEQMNIRKKRVMEAERPSDIAYHAAELAEHAAKAEQAEAMVFETGAVSRNTELAEAIQKKGATQMDVYKHFLADQA